MVLHRCIKVVFLGELPGALTETLSYAERVPQIELEQVAVSSGMSAISRMIDDGQYSQASAALKLPIDGSPDELELMGLKLAVAQHSLEPSRALQMVLAILREDPHQSTALKLYREFSLLQYQAGRSCLSHSHPPPALD